MENKLLKTSSRRGEATSPLVPTCYYICHHWADMIICREATQREPATQHEAGCCHFVAALETSLTAPALLYHVCSAPRALVNSISLSSNQTSLRGISLTGSPLLVLPYSKYVPDETENTSSIVFTNSASVDTRLHLLLISADASWWKTAAFNKSLTDFIQLFSIINSRIRSIKRWNSLWPCHHPFKSNTVGAKKYWHSELDLTSDAALNTFL